MKSEGVPSCFFLGRREKRALALFCGAVTDLSTPVFALIGRALAARASLAWRRDPLNVAVFHKLYHGLSAAACTVM
jgi:hypothetical protein